MFNKKLIATMMTAGMISVSGMTAFAAGNTQAQFRGQGTFGGPMQNNQTMQNNQNMNNGQFQNNQNFGDQAFAGDQSNLLSSYTTADSASDIVTTSVTNTAKDLAVNDSDIQEITMSSDNSEVKIESSGTYKVTGSCSDGNLVVKKNTTGVVLILEDLSLTSTVGAPLSLNKYSEVKVVVNGNVTLTDNEDIADEETDDFDGAAIKAKDGSNVYICGDGTLNVNGNCKNGIKVGDADSPSFVIDMNGTVNIDAANDGINGGYDVTLLSGKFNVSADDDGLHADRILTIGADGKSPVINVKNSYEAVEGTVVNLVSGSGTFTSSDDGVNAANSDGTYSSEMDFSINITGGDWQINASGDGLDSNGNINLVNGSATIKSATTGGEAGIDVDGSLYISDSFNLNNSSGVSNMGEMGQQGQMPEMNNQQNTQQVQVPQQNQTQQNTQQRQVPQQNQAPQQNTQQNQRNNTQMQMPGMGGQMQMPGMSNNAGRGRR